MTEKYFYISKEIFYHNQLSITEARLLIMISSQQYLSLDTMSFEMRKWIAGNNNKMKLLPKSESILKELKLIHENGTGLTLNSNYIRFNSLKEIEKCKTMRQLFVLCLSKWDKRGKIIVPSEMFYNLLGSKETYIINKNLKYVCNSLDIYYEWKILKEFIYIIPIKKSENKKNKQKLSIKNTNNNNQQIDRSSVDDFLSRVKTTYMTPPPPEPEGLGETLPNDYFDN